MSVQDRECAERIEELVGRIRAIRDPECRDIAQRLMESILELHGAGLERIVHMAGETTTREFARDPLVSSLLILHDLHPDDLSTRVHRALGKWHGAAELVGEFEGVVRVQLSAGGCDVKAAVLAAIQEAAPDAIEIIVEEGSVSGFIPLEALIMPGAH